MAEALIPLVEEVRACRLCEARLPHAPRPVLRADPRARLLVVGQAPGTRVHETGIPWNDPSGEQLRDWLAMSPEEFYDISRVAIIPMGLCYPGRGRGGDLPPRPECAPTWHPRLRAALPGIRLTLLVGRHAQAWYLATGRERLGDTVWRYRDFLPGFFPLPHPSPRNRKWLRERPWFEQRVVPALRREVRRALD